MGKNFANQLVKMRTATFKPMLDIINCFDAMEYYEQFEQKKTEQHALPKDNEEDLSKQFLKLRSNRR
jgi:hypothetical protein